MELKVESMTNAKKVVEHCLEQLMEKPDLTPAETKAMLDGLKLHDELCCRIEDCNKTDDYSERNYSGSMMPNHRYHITSYGMPERSMNNGYNGSYENNGSMRSYRGSYYGEPRYYGEEYSDRGRGYSRHSISDRVVSMVEQMMDSVQSDYERQELQKYIKAIRAMGMTD